MRLGIIIPYRDRLEHLQTTTPILSRIGEVFVIEQHDNKPFNRAKLLNIGYLKCKDAFDYFAAHDVDMIPERMDYYLYPYNPCHIATMTEQFGYMMPYPDYFGGVTLFPNHKFEQVNGYSNEYWSYGGEDDEIKRRFTEKKIPIESRQCRFSSLPHERIIDRELRMKNVARLRAPVDWEDGLSSCKYHIVTIEKSEYYTLLKVQL